MTVPLLGLATLIKDKELESTSEAVNVPVLAVCSLVVIVAEIATGAVFGAGVVVKL